MKKRSACRLALRLTAALFLTGALVWLFPEWWLTLCRPFMAFVIEQATPWLSAVSVQVDGTMLMIRGQLDLGVTQIDGQPVPGLDTQWGRPGDKYMILLIVACATWVLPAASWRQRVLALPLTLLLTVCITAATLTNEVKSTGLREMGGGALRHIELENTSENIERLQGFERQLRRVIWVKSFNDAGGNIFLAVLAGLAGYAMPRLPAHWRTRMFQQAADFNAKVAKFRSGGLD